MTRRDVIWVTWESVRYDHTSEGGYGRTTTPFLERLAETGTSFEYCYSHGVWTRPSTSSILTGHPPSAHRAWTDHDTLPSEIETIPEAFDSAGYRTVGTSPNGQISAQTELDRGFEDFHFLIRDNILEEAGLRSLLKYLFNIRRHSAGATRDTRQHCTGYLSNEIAKRQIRETEQSDEPLFMYAHLGDSHHPYVPPVSWREKFLDDVDISADEAVDVALDMSDRFYEHIVDDLPFSEAEWNALIALYDASIAYVDHLTEDLITYCESVLDDPIIVVTADHGELFGESGLLEHMLVANSAVTNVPLVLKGLSGVEGDGPVQHCDVMKMLCEDLSIEHPVPIGRDIRTEPREFAFVQRGGARAVHKFDQLREHDAEFDVDQFHAEDLTSIRSSEWRYQRSSQREELYQLPNESRDVSSQHPERVEEMTTRIDDWMSEYGEPVGETGTADFDDATEEHLRDLGYLT